MEGTGRPQFSASAKVSQPQHHSQMLKSSAYPKNALGSTSVRQSFKKLTTVSRTHDEIYCRICLDTNQETLGCRPVWTAIWTRQSLSETKSSESGLARRFPKDQTHAPHYAASLLGRIRQKR